MEREQPGEEQKRQRHEAASLMWRGLRRPEGKGERRDEDDRKHEDVDSEGPPVEQEVGGHAHGQGASEHRQTLCRRRHRGRFWATAVSELLFAAAAGQ